MLRHHFFALLVTIVFLATPAPSHAASDDIVRGLLVKYRHAPPATAGRHIGHNVVAVEIEEGPAHPAFAARMRSLRADPAVEYVELNYRGAFADPPEPVALPNDPGFASQWWLDQLGARQAWAVTQGKGIVVAVLDSGADFNHPDLAAALLGNAYNFGDGTADAQDQIGHGTFVVGIIAARCGNATAGCGLAPQARVLPIKISQGAADSFDSAALAQGIDYAVAQGAHVINLSLTVTEETRTVGAAIQRALDAGVIVVAAAGNKGGEVKFPGTYPGVICVAGSNRDRTLWSGSSRGAEVTLAAPASEVHSTLLNGGFGARSQGTSYAAPMVAASVALLLTSDARLTAPRIAVLLRETAGKLEGGDYPYGILDSAQALLALLPELTPDKREYANGDSVRLAYRLPQTAGPVDIYVAVETPGEAWSLHPDGVWRQAAQHGYLPLGSSAAPTAGGEGILFGATGIFPAIRLENVAVGRYVWQSALVDRQSGRIIGTTVASPVLVK